MCALHSGLFKSQKAYLIINLYLCRALQSIYKTVICFGQAYITIMTANFDINLFFIKTHLIPCFHVTFIDLHGIN